MYQFLRYITIALTLGGSYAALSPDPKGPALDKRRLVTDLVNTCNSSCSGFEATVKSCDISLNGQSVQYSSCLCKQASYSSDAKTCIDCIALSGNDTLISETQLLLYLCEANGLVNITTASLLSPDSFLALPGASSNGSSTIVFDDSTQSSSIGSQESTSATATPTINGGSTMVTTVVSNPAGSTVVINMTGSGTAKNFSVHAFAYICVAFLMGFLL